MLQERVELLLGEHERLASETDRAVKAKLDMEKKFKELQAKVSANCE